MPEILDLTSSSPAPSPAKKAARPPFAAPPKPAAPADAAPVDKARLIYRINEMAEDDLQEMLKALINKSEEAARLTEEMVFPASTKRGKGGEKFMCENCGEDFTFDDAVEEDCDCSYHPGFLVLDEDADCWYSWNEGRGPMDTAANEAEMPEGFKWSCCDENAEGGGGCETGHDCEERHDSRRPKL